MANQQYTSVDMQLINQRLNEVLQGSGTDAGRLRDRVQTLDTTSKLTTFGGVQRAQTDDTSGKMASFQNMTDVLAQMNEAYNANTYIASNLSRERRRVQHLDNELRKEMWKARQRALGTQYRIEHQRFRLRVIMGTAVVTVLVLLLAAVWRQGRLWTWLFFTLAAALLLVWGVGLALYMRRNAMRRRLHWNQYYWRVTGDALNETKKSAEASCPGGVGAMEAGGGGGDEDA